MSKQGHSQEQIDRKLHYIDTLNEEILRLKNLKSLYEQDKKLMKGFVGKYHDTDILKNNIQIYEHKVRILESELLIDKLRKQNYKIKTQHDLLV